MKRKFLDGYKTYDTAGGFGSPDEWQDAFSDRMDMTEARQRMDGHMDILHEILGVPPGASAQEIKAAFRRLLKEWHPDHNPHRLKEAAEQTIRIIAAFTILSKP